MSESAFNASKSAIKSLLEHADVDSGRSRIGFFVFDQAVRLGSVIDLTNMTTKKAIMDAIDKVQYIPSTGQVMITTALRHVFEMFNSTSRGDRKDAANIVYLFSDMSVSFANSTVLSQQLKDQGTYIHVAILRYNTTDESALTVITDGRVMVADNYTMLNEIIASSFHEPKCSKLT